MSRLELTAAAGACPSWCALPAGHDLDVTSSRTALVHREHYRSVIGDDDPLAYVGVVRIDVALGEAGPTLTGPTLVEVSVVDGEHMTAQRARALAGALLDAAALVDDAATDGGAW